MFKSLMRNEQCDKNNIHLCPASAHAHCLQTHGKAKRVFKDKNKIFSLIDLPKMVCWSKTNKQTNNRHQENLSDSKIYWPGDDGSVILSCCFETAELHAHVWSQHSGCGQILSSGKGFLEQSC